MDQQQRLAVIEMAHTGNGPVAIYKALNYPKRTVYDAYKRWMTMGEDKRKQHKSTSDKKRMPRFVAGLKKSVAAVLSTPSASWPRRGR